MLDLSQLKNLTPPKKIPGEYPDHQTGTRLRRLRDMGYGKSAGSIIYFNGYNSFREDDGTLHVTHGNLFRIPGGAKCWDDFSKRGRQWIEGNFRAEVEFAFLSFWEPRGNSFDSIDMADIELAE